MLSRTLPSTDDLLARAIAAADFRREVAEGPHELRIVAEICAEKAAEAWENETGAAIGTVSADQIAAVRTRLIEWHQRIERARADAARESGSERTNTERRRAAAAATRFAGWPL
jgi:predicted house-cleaning NTP pyrophosphatase (Maf/HAM1 superfamily)